MTDPYKGWTGRKVGLDQKESVWSWFPNRKKGFVIEQRGKNLFTLYSAINVACYPEENLFPTTTDLLGRFPSFRRARRHAENINV